MKWFKFLFRLFVKGEVETEVDPCRCHLCHDSGVVGFRAGNSHFTEGYYYRRCPNECELTHYGRMKLA